MSLHGIRTRGVWQKDLVPVLALSSFVPYALDYGSFSVFKFASPWARNSKLEWLRKEYERVTAEARVQRPSIIAHSFGTYLVANLLHKYAELKFDKVILAGSIIKRDFDWDEIFRRGQVNSLRNDYGSLDPWPRLARYLVPSCGPSGTKGFTSRHPRLIQASFPSHKHSDYFHRHHFTTYWIPTLLTPVVSQADRAAFVETMDVAAQTVATRLNIDLQLIRANIFMPDGTGRLVIPDGLHYNMRNPQETAISIAPGTGCTGTAFAERTPTIAIMRRTWGPHTLPQSILTHVDARLRWIVSVPIPDPDVPGVVCGIFTVDCLDVASERQELEVLVEDLTAIAQAVSALLKSLN